MQPHPSTFDFDAALNKRCYGVLFIIGMFVDTIWGLKYACTLKRSVYVHSFSNLEGR